VATSLRNLAYAVTAIALALAPSKAASINKITVFATGTAVNGTAPDSVTVSNDSVWVAYTNGADSTGALGGSTVVQYDFTGKVLHTYFVAGYVDGLKYDPERNLIWALQNQDGNSTLTFIDPVRNVMTLNSPYSYTVPNASRGYDDVAFLHGQVFMSYTNPVVASDPTIQLITPPNLTQAATINVTPILTMGATGLNLATGATQQPTFQTDPDSLKTTPWGGSC
jgi:hypothetical protein